MKRFAHLFATLDGTTSTNVKVAAMTDYFATASAEDAAWAVFFLSGRRFTRLLAARAIGGWIATVSGFGDWLLSECHAIVGDQAETLSLLVDQDPGDGAREAPEASEASLREWVEERLLPLRGAPADVQQARVLDWLSHLPRWERLTLLKILTGELRLGVSSSLVVRALARLTHLPEPTIATRLAGDWTPSADWFTALIAQAAVAAEPSQPYPFCLASPFAEAAAEIGDVHDWSVEWKWDGIRAQIIRRDAQTWIWSRGDELMTKRFPEVRQTAARFPDGTVIDGEILGFADGKPLPFSSLQTRIGRQSGIERRRQDVPVVFMAFDLLEIDGHDLRALPLRERRQRLAALIAALDGQPVSSRPAPISLPLLPFDRSPEANHATDAVMLSPLLPADDWERVRERRRDARRHGVEGVMLKRWASPYGVGRKRGDWWKWKVDPFVVDAVLVYAQPGSGQRASLLTDYTFAVWDGDELVPIAKAYSGLTNEEVGELDRWIRRHTVGRFGPVRHVEPVQVFELGFEAIARSPRRRSGVALRFPRMLRWRRDKGARDADTLQGLMAMLPEPHSRSFPGRS